MGAANDSGSGRLNAYSVLKYTLENNGGPSAIGGSGVVVTFNDHLAIKSAFFWLSYGWRVGGGRFPQPANLLPSRVERLAEDGKLKADLLLRWVE